MGTSGPRWQTVAIFLLLGCSGLTRLSAETAPPLPQEKGKWLNSPPISEKATTGKAVFFYFFEEG